MSIKTPGHHLRLLRPQEIEPAIQSYNARKRVRDQLLAEARSLGTEAIQECLKKFKTQDDEDAQLATDHFLATKLAPKR